MNSQYFITRLTHLGLARQATLLLAMLAALGLARPAFADPIFDAVWKGNLAKVQQLLKTNADLVFSKDKKGSTPLMCAAFAGRKDVAALLIASGADVDARNNGGDTALVLAAYQRHEDVAELLLANKADANARNNNYGMTPLLYAAEKGPKEMVELLLANNADVNARNNNGDTPLMQAMFTGHRDIVELLLNNKADVTAKDNNGVTPIQLTNLKRYADLAELLRQHLSPAAHTDESDPKSNPPETPTRTQSPPSPAAGEALIYVYHLNERTKSSPCCEVNSKVVVDTDSLDVDHVDTYSIYTVTAPFPIWIGFYSISNKPVPNGMPCVKSESSDLRWIYTLCPSVVQPVSDPLILMRVEPGKTYYVQYRPIMAFNRGDMKLEKESSGIEDMRGLKFTQARHFAPPTLEQAISTIQTGLMNADRTAQGTCMQRPPLQEISVTKDGFHYVDTGTIKEGFRKKDYSASFSTHFQGMPYQQLSPGAGSFRLPINDFTPALGSGIKSCITNLNTYDLPGFVNAINRLIWEATTGAEQPMGANATPGNH